MSDGPLVLGIETSCDETGVGIVRGNTLLADAVASSVDEHARFGGVVPEVASRAHLEAMVPTIERACETAGVAAARRRRHRRDRGPGPGRAPCWSGWPPPRRWPSGWASRCTASTTSPRTSRSTSSSTVRCPSPAWPCWSAAATPACSGSRTSPATSTRWARPSTTRPVRRSTRWPGSSGLPFPGGPHIDRAAREGDSVYVDFPRGLTSRRDLERHRFDFSFSGLKTAVARWVEARERSRRAGAGLHDVAASFQEAVCDVLTRKAVDAAATHGIDHLLIGGGVAANSRLRSMAEERAAARGIRVRVPRPGLCTDNGAMVAALGAEMVTRGRAPSALDLPADSSHAGHRASGLSRWSGPRVESEVLSERRTSSVPAAGRRRGSAGRSMLSPRSAVDGDPIAPSSRPGRAAPS